MGSGKWEVGSGKWEVGSGKWEVGMGMGMGTAVAMAMRRPAAWSDGDLIVIDVLGEGTSGAVEAVEVARNG